MEYRCQPLILAAGGGQRMGQPKIFCCLNGRSFPELILAALPSGLPPPLVVVRGEILAEACRRYGFAAEWLVNPDPDSGMASSVAIGLGVSRGDALIILPVDVPCFRKESVAKLIALAARNPGAVVRPLYRGRGGHPLIVPAAIKPFLDGGGGTLREAIRRSGIRQVTCEIEDPGLVININTPAELRRVEDELSGI